jgi:xylose dehydrogenase (NAD/NADP)
VSEPVSFGFLSTAKINELLLEAARSCDRVRVLAVASRDATRGEAYAREHGIERAYGAYEELLADADVEAVYVPLPNSMHIDWSIRALEAGKHVLCEKPLSRRPEEVERAFDAAERAGRLLMEAFMYRHHPQTARIHELVQGGAIGGCTCFAPPSASTSWAGAVPRTSASAPISTAAR